VSKEAAAAILTKLYFEEARQTASRIAIVHADPVSIESAERIGYVYGTFLASLDKYATWGEKLAKKEHP
jgi:hypothetical protein